VSERSTAGVVVMLGGVVVLVIGALMWLGVLSWLGKLPGDIRVERPGFRFYAPITSMIIISVVLTLLMLLARRLWP
jgi:Protein of unknown function (DUF2905)